MAQPVMVMMTMDTTISTAP